MNHNSLSINKFTKKNIGKIFLSIFFATQLTACSDNSKKSNNASAPVIQDPQKEISFSSTESQNFDGNIFHVITLKDDQYAFASISNKEIKDNVENIKKKGVIAVLKKEQNSWKTQHYITVNSPELNNTGNVSSVFGLALTPDESILAVAMDKKVALFDVKATLQGETPAYYINMDTFYDNRTGAIAVVAAADNKHFFVANEYGRIEGHAGIGDVAIISAELTGAGQIVGKKLGYIKTGQNTIASLNISPDKKTLYIPNQVAPKQISATFHGSHHSILSKQCVNNNYNGSISIIDVDKAITVANQNSENENKVIEDVILANVATGCNAVRVAPSHDGKIVWVTARGSAYIRENLIHAYDAALLRTNPNNAYLYSFQSNGESPIGIVSFDQDRHIAVSNSNRFNVTDAQGNLLPSNISIFNVEDRNNPKLVQTINSGIFPRDISTSHDLKSIYVANWESGIFQEITKALN